MENGTNKDDTGMAVEQLPGEQRGRELIPALVSHSALLLGGSGKRC